MRHLVHPASFINIIMKCTLSDPIIIQNQCKNSSLTEILLISHEDYLFKVVFKNVSSCCYS